jgi:hypothetical protein
MHSMVRTTTSCNFFVVSMVETINTTQYELVITIFVKVLMAHLFRKIQDFIIYLSRNIGQIKKRKIEKFKKMGT